jgi:Ser/Thr protein kinase RdoA (MazF antagonist)
MARLAPATAAEAARRWGRDPGSLVPVSRGVNHVFRAEDLYLRLVHTTLRGERFLGPPLCFLRHAFDRGAPVAQPVPSDAGRWIEALPQGEDVFLATGVRAVKGTRLGELPLSAELYRAFGRAIGELHARTRDFLPVAGTPNMFAPERPGVFPTWRWLWAQARKHANRDPIIAKAFEDLTPWVEARGGLPGSWPADDPRPVPGYGLTHGDMRPGNVIWTGERAVIIDFDEPVHGPLANDLARAMLELDVPERHRLQSYLVAGYREAMPLSQEWIEAISALLPARAALMCAWTLEDESDTEPPASASGSGATVSFSRLRSSLREGTLIA